MVYIDFALYQTAQKCKLRRISHYNINININVNINILINSNINNRDL